MKFYGTEDGSSYHPPFFASVVGITKNIESPMKALLHNVFTLSNHFNFRVEETTKVFLHKNLFLTWILSYGFQITGTILGSTLEKKKVSNLYLLHLSCYMLERWHWKVHFQKGFFSFCNILFSGLVHGFSHSHSVYVDFFLLLDVIGRTKSAACSCFRISIKKAPTLPICNCWMG